eukprot:scaffold1366_cov155-Skeletonema_menzelii.AAC.8
MVIKGWHHQRDQRELPHVDQVSSRWPHFPSNWLLARLRLMSPPRFASSSGIARVFFQRKAEGDITYGYLQPCYYRARYGEEQKEKKTSEPD